MPSKPKTNQPETPQVQQMRDLFQTPVYATALIEPYLRKFNNIWECCCGQGKISAYLNELGYGVLSTDISMGSQFDALTYEPNDYVDAVITNPPYSIKRKLVKRFVEYEKPFAFLVPGDWTGWMIEAIDKYDCKLLVPTRRINYITPTGKYGKESAAQFHSVWLTRGLLRDRLTFVELTKETMNNI